MYTPSLYQLAGWLPRWGAVGAVVAALLPGFSQGQVLLTAAGTQPVQDFNTLSRTTASSVVPTGWAFVEAGNNANTTYSTSTGAATAGDTYSLGSNNATDRAFGALRSSNLISTIGASFRNDTGQPITTLGVAYAGEQWSLAATGRADQLAFEYSLNATSLSSGSWTAVAALNFNSPKTTGSTGALDGNLAANRTAIAGLISGLNIASGSTVWFRWLDVDAPGTDDALGVDDFVLTVPITYYAKPTGNLNLTTTFGTNTDGTGTAPPNFTGALATYNVGGTGRTIAADWTVSGLGSKVVLGSNASFTVPTAANFTGTLDLGAGAQLTELNAAPAVTFGAVDASSTVEYAQSGSYTLPAFPAAGYGNLTLRNGTKTLPNSTSNLVRGNLLIDNVSGFGGGTVSPFTTLSLGGNLTLSGTVTFNAAGKITLLTTSTTTQQVFQGNGNTLRLVRLATTAAPAGTLPAPGVVLSGNTTPLELGDASGGGYQLEANTMLYVNNNTLTFIADGRAAMLGTGTVTADVGANFVLNRALNSGGSIGTLRLPATATTNINNLTLNLGSISATAFDSLSVSGTLLVGGTATLNRGHLFIGAGSAVTFAGPFSVANAASSLLGSPIGGTTTSDFVLSGTGTVDTLTFARGVAQLRSFTVNRSDVPTIYVASDVRLNGTLTLTSGRLEMLPAPATPNLPNNNYRVYVNSTGGLVGGSSSSYVNGLTLAAITNSSDQTVTLNYPLGKRGQYRPVTLVVTQSSGTTYYTARHFEQAPPVRALSTATTTATVPPLSTTPLTRVSQLRYFNITPEVTTNSVAASAATITLSYVPASDRANNDDSLRIAKSSSPSSAWVSIGGTGNGSNITSGTFTGFSDFTLATVARLTSNNPLPVELTRFAAVRSPGGVRLSWATASEKNSAYFEVQRRGAGFNSTFATVATVGAAGTSGSPRQYEAFDNYLSAGTVYYRLRQVDQDGTSAYSGVVAVQAAGAAETPLVKASFYPNPTTDGVTVSDARLAGQPVHILDLTGREVGRTTIAPDGQVSLRALQAGTYLLQVQQGSSTVTRRITRQ